MCDSSRLMLISYNRLRPPHHRPLHRYPLRVYRLIRRRRLTTIEEKREVEKKIAVDVEAEMEMEIKNLELYMQNQSIIEENEKLRKKAFLLHKENQVLLSQLQNFSKQQLKPLI